MFSIDSSCSSVLKQHCLSVIPILFSRVQCKLADEKNLFIQNLMSQIIKMIQNMKNDQKSEIFTTLKTVCRACSLFTTKPKVKINPQPNERYPNDLGIGIRVSRTKHNYKYQTWKKLFDSIKEKYDSTTYRKILSL